MSATGLKHVGALGAETTLCDSRAAPALSEDDGARSDCIACLYKLAQKHEDAFTSCIRDVNVKIAEATLVREKYEREHAVLTDAAGEALERSRALGAEIDALRARLAAVSSGNAAPVDN